MLTRAKALRELSDKDTGNGIVIRILVGPICRRLCPTLTNDGSSSTPHERVMKASFGDVQRIGGECDT